MAIRIDGAQDDGNGLVKLQVHEDGSVSAPIGSDATPSTGGGGADARWTDGTEVAEIDMVSADDATIFADQQFLVQATGITTSSVFDTNITAGDALNLQGAGTTRLVVDTGDAGGGLTLTPANEGANVNAVLSANGDVAINSVGGTVSINGAAVAAPNAQDQFLQGSGAIDPTKAHTDLEGDALDPSTFTIAAGTINGFEKTIRASANAAGTITVTGAFRIQAGTGTMPTQLNMDEDNQGARLVWQSASSRWVIRELLNGATATAP